MDLTTLCPRCFEEAVGPNGFCTRCGAAGEGGRTRYPQALPLFSILQDRYLIGAVLGAGGFGITYLALDLAAQERCAVKEFFPAELVHRGEDGCDVEMPASRQEDVRYGLRRFCDEAQVLASLDDCPSVVRVRDFFQWNRTAYMVMEFVEGPSLNQFCREHGNLSFQRGQDIFIDLCLTLIEVHGHSLLHRDISPENILLMADGEVRLIDFGAARYVMGERSKSLSVVLKKGYAPPEQYSSHGRQGPWTDLYALAGTLYYALTGTHVPDAMDRLADKEMPPLAALRPDVPQGFSRILSRCLELDHRRRYQSAQEVLDAVMAADWYQTQLVKPGASAGGLPQVAKSTAAPTPGRKSLFEALKFRRRQPVLELLGGPLSGQRYPMTVPETLIGRSQANCQIVLKGDADISRRHCRIRFEKQGRMTLEDLSRNGTFWADGKRLQPGLAVPLSWGQVFYLADRRYTMRVVRAKL